MRFLTFAASPLVLAAVAAGFGTHGLEHAAHAAGGIARAPASSAAVVDARIAVARSGTGAAARTTVWSSVRVDHAAGGFVWLVPARHASAVDVASDAWLDALEAATAPRIVPPAATLSCSVTRTTEIAGDLTRARAATPIDTTMVPTMAGLEAHLTAWGFALDVTLADRARAVFDRGDELVAMTFAGATPEVVTPTVRVVGDEPLALPMVMTRSGTDAVRVTAFAFAPTRMAFGTAASLTIDGRHVTWSQAGKSSYSSVRSAALATSPSLGGAFFVEAAGPAALFGDGVATVEGAPLPSIAREYPARIAEIGARADDGGVFAAERCEESLRAAARYAGSVAEACPRGDLAPLGAADGGPSSCVERPAAGEVSANAFRCDGVADDLAFAVGGAPASSVWITRAVGTVRAGELGRDVVLRADPGAPRAPVVVADSYAFTCGSAPSNPTNPSYPGPSSSGGSSSGSGSGGSGSSGSSQGSGYSNGAGTVAVAVASDGCGSSGTSSSSSDDSCGGGPTTTGDDSGVDSSGDPSTAGAGVDACSGDTTSDSSDTSGDDCSSDDGSASGDDDACMGDSSDSSSSDDSCSSKPADAKPGTLASLARATAAPSKAATQHVTKVRSRSPVSRAVLGFAFLLLPLRRRLRKR